MLDTALADSLAQAVGSDNLFTQEDVIDRYSADALNPARAFRAAARLERTADMVVVPHSVQQVAEVVKLASAYGVPVIPYGGGTGVMGAALPVEGGVVIDLKGLNKILDINATDRTALVEAGVVLEDLDKSLEERGLMLGHDPWSRPIATVAGAISTNSVGYRAASYGPMGEQVMGLEVVLPNGEVLSTRAVPKYSSGPNLNHLFIGSEGAFGIITKATIRVFRQPEKRAFSTVAFNTFDQGFNAVSELFELGLRPTLLDLTEEDEDVHLYMMHEGYREGVDAQHRRSLAVCAGFRGRNMGKGETMNHWKDRHSSGHRYRREMLNQPRSVRWDRWGRRGFDYLHMALPVSQVLEYRRRCDEFLSRQGVRVVEYAIWTQPELFSMMLVPDERPDHGNNSRRGNNNRDNSGAIDNMGDIVDQVLTLSQDMGGTMEYCHGVGVKLSHLLPREMGVGYDVAKAIKQALDPQNIMNPGKLYY